MIKKIRELITMVLIVTMLPIFTICSYASSETTISVDTAVVEEGGSVSIPIKLSNSTGICGATISVAYNSELKLTGIDKGDAWGTLTMTKPGKFNANPVKITWDGLEEDYTNGAIAILTFMVPDKAGNYDVRVSYEDGDILDGNLTPVNVITQNGGITVAKKESIVEPIISVGNVESNPGEQVQVPISISGNTGICGATISIAYESGLTLTGIDKGDAWGTLVMTRPGKFNANPVKITWDGLEEDNTNGVIAVLTFTAPEQAGTYGVSVSYEEGDILNGDLNFVNPTIEQGQVTVISSESEKIIAENIGVFYADDGYEGNSLVSTAFKANLSGVNGKISFTVTAAKGEARTFNNFTTITDSDVVLGIVVSGLEDKKAIGEITIE